jgi:hypothetical protein
MFMPLLIDRAVQTMVLRSNTDEFPPKKTKVPRDRLIIRASHQHTTIGVGNKRPRRQRHNYACLICHRQKIMATTIQGERQCQ